MSNLILIRHSHSQTDPALPAEQWGLSEKGRERCIPLAEQLAPYALTTIITSREPKARQTGEITAARLNIPCTTADNLHEHVRTHEKWYDSQAEFEARVLEFFAKPDQRVYGSETARAAGDRISVAVQQIVTSYAGQSIAIVTHGTVLTLLMQRTTPNFDPIPFWKALGLPAYVGLRLPDLSLEKVVNTI